MVVWNCVGFATVCRQSTDFHFPGIDTQFQEIREHSKTANQKRKENQFTMLSSNSYTSESRLSNSGSPIHLSENGIHVPTLITCNKNHMASYIVWIICSKNRVVDTS